MAEPYNLEAVRLSSADRESLAGYAARATWPAGFAVFTRGTPADGVFIVTRGRIILRSRVKSTRGFVPWVASPGESFGAEGLQPGARYVTDARADQASETLFISSANFRAFMREQPQQAVALMGQLMAERTALLEKLRELTTLSVEQRLLTTLLRLSTNCTFTRPDGRVELDSAHYRLVCEMVGATRESVSLVLARLTGDGLVERRGTTLIAAPASRLAERIELPAFADELFVNDINPQSAVS